MLATDDTPLSRQEREQLVVEVQHETFGLGPIEPLMQDPTVSDILVNGPRSVYVERRGKLERTRVIFRDDTHLLQVIERIVSAVGRRVDESSPMVDARLPDGSRINAIIPPLALDGPVLSIRRFAVDPLKTEDLLELGTWTPALSEIIRAAVKSRLNILISGGTGSGKTTLLNVISEAIPNHERIVTVEDSAELQLQQEHKVRLETRPANVEGAGSVTQRDLVRNALRMRPDRIILGEVRGAEVLDMLQAMNTGHDGSLSTVHANSTRDALARLETMILLSGISLPVRAMRDYIASALDVVIHLSRLSDGTRKILRLTEVVGMEEDVVTTQDIFVFEQEGIDKDGKVIGYHRATGVRPKFADRLRAGRHRAAPGHVRPHQAPGDALMPLAVAALTFLLVVALIAGITWSFEGTRRLRQRLAAGSSAGLGVEGDLLRVEAGRGRDGGSRAGPPSAIAWRALPTRRAIPAMASNIVLVYRRLRPPRLLAGMDADGRAHLGDGGGRRRGLRSSRVPRLEAAEAHAAVRDTVPRRARRHGARHPSRKRPQHRDPARRRRDGRSHRGRVPPGIRGNEARHGSRRGAFTAVRAYADGRRPVLLHRRRHPARLGR